MSVEVKRYHPALIILHWLLALVIAGVYVLGSFVLDDMENSDPGKANLLSLHLVAGIAILVLTALRLIVRVRMPKPAPMPGSRAVQKVATGLQHLMYTLTVLVVVAGLVLAFQADLFSVLFGHSGSLPKDFEGYTSHDIHGLLANTLLGVAALHVAAALQHQFLIKDNIMARISPFAKD